MQRLATTERLTVPSSDGTPIALWKSGTGPSLLAVHGTCADHTAWDSVVPLLADRFTVYALDRRGRGASGDAPAYALEREFEDVAAAVDALPGPVHLYGHSGGSICAVEAATRTRNLGRVVLYEGGGLKPPGMRFSPEEFIVRLEQLIEAGQCEEAVSTFMLTAAGVTPEELEVLGHHPAWPARVAAAHTIPRELRAFNEYGTDPARFSAITAPVLLVVGELTEARRREMFEGLAHVIKNARVAVLPGQRHAAHRRLLTFSPRRCATSSWLQGNRPDASRRRDQRRRRPLGGGTFVTVFVARPLAQTTEIGR